MRSLTSTIAIVAVLLSIPLTTKSQARREAIEASERRRNAAFAEATGLTGDQARTVYAQILAPPLAPELLDLVTRTRADGSKRLYLFMRHTAQADCVARGNSRRDCRDSDRVWTHFLYVHVDAAGRVVRTAHHLPFDHNLDRRPRELRFHLLDQDDGSDPLVLFEEPFAGHDDADEQFLPKHLEVYNGRTAQRVTRFHSRLSDAARRYVRLARDEQGQLVSESLACEAGCRCRPPRDPQDAARRFAQEARRRRCDTVQTPYAVSTSLRFVRDDLDALTPPPSDQVLAERRDGLKRAASFTAAQADAFLANHPYAIPSRARFTTGLREPSPSGGFTQYLGLTYTTFDRCVYQRRGRMYDAVRACAHERGTRHKIYAAEVSRDGTVTRSRELTAEPLMAAYRVLDEQGDIVIALVTGEGRSIAVRFYRGFDRVQGVLAFQVSGDRTLGRLNAHPVDGRPTVHRLTATKIVCSRACDCGEADQTDVDAVLSRASHSAASRRACYFREEDVTWRRR